MINLEQRRRWAEALHEQNLERERLFKLIASLANLFDKATVVKTIESVLEITPVETENGVLFDNLTVNFSNSGRVTSIYHTIDGTTEPAKTIIQSLTENASDS